MTSRFTTSSAFQCYEVLPSLHDFVSYIQQDVCPRADTRCSKGANRLQRADYLDIDYDAISRNLVLTSFHHKPPDPHGWDGHIKSHSNSSNTEVGLLTNEQAITPEELSLGGYLTVIGEDQKPSMPASLLRILDLTILLSRPNPFLLSKSIPSCPTYLRFNLSRHIPATHRSSPHSTLDVPLLICITPSSSMRPPHLPYHPLPSLRR